MTQFYVENVENCLERRRYRVCINWFSFLSLRRKSSTIKPPKPCKRQMANGANARMQVRIPKRQKQVQEIIKRSEEGSKKQIERLRGWVKKGKAWAMCMLADRYKDGVGVKQSDKKATIELIIRNGSKKRKC
jgi:hypothetical protein